MPGFNQRGPDGQGPLTGGGRGRCAGYAAPAWGAPLAQGQGRGLGPCGDGRALGRGGRGRGYGRGCAAGYPADYAPAATEPSAQDLQAEARELRQRLARVEASLAGRESD